MGSIANRVGASSSSNSDAGSSQQWHLSYPAMLVLERDQGAHNMCLVDSGTKLAIDDALNVSKKERESILTYAVGGQYDDSSRHFKKRTSRVFSHQAYFKKH